jgi:hypothetical protein
MIGKQFSIGSGIIVIVEKVNPAEIVCRDINGAHAGIVRTISLHKFVARASAV